MATLGALSAADVDQRLDRTPFVHRLVRVEDMVEVGFVVEHAPGIDRPGENVREKLGDIPACR